MKHCLAALTATALIGLAPYALATSSTDLSVTGAITPAACTPSLSDGGVIDHGKISKKDLNAATYTNIGVHTIRLSVSCEAPGTFALRSIDNRAGTPSNRDWYGLGNTPANEKIGFVIPMMKGVVADGQPARTIISWDNGASWGAHHHLRPNILIAAGSPSDTTTPMIAQDVAFEIDVSTHIAATDGLTLNDEVSFDGSVTFDMTYF